MGLILISHDLELVASFCDRILVMYAGRIVENCPRRRSARRAILYARPDRLPAAAFRRQPPLPVLDRDPAWAL